MAQGCTTRQAELILYAELTAKRQSSHRPVFTDIFVTYDSYRDPSLLLRMTSGRREGKHVTQSNIYRLSSIFYLLTHAPILRRLRRHLPADAVILNAVKNLVACSK